MKLGLVTGFGPAQGPEAATTVVEAAEALGFESVWVTEHVVVPVRYDSPYPYDTSGELPIGPHADLPEPLAWLAFAAARTTHILLGTGCVILPLRNPVVLAKQAATLDRLAGGRLRLGVGLGWMREEAEAVGATWDDRAARAEASIEAMRALWTGEPATWSGPGVAFADVVCRPTPAHGTVPIHVCGPSERAAARAGRMGEGFFTNEQDPGRVRRLVQVVREAAERAGRDPDAIEITAGGLPHRDTIERLAALGVDRMVWAVPLKDPARVVRQLERIAARVIEEAA